MDPIAFVFTAILVGGPIVRVLYRNQRDYNRAKEDNPVTPYLIRARHVWDGAPADVRDILLQSAGVELEAARNVLIIKDWNRLPGDIVTALLKVQILTEVEASQSPGLQQLRERLK